MVTSNPGYEMMQLLNLSLRKDCVCVCKVFFCFVTLPADPQRQQQLPQQAHHSVLPPADRPRVSHRCHLCPHAAGDGSGQDEEGLH